MASEIAKAYVQIVPSADGVSGSISKVLGGEAESAGKSSGSALAGSLFKTFSAVLAGMGIGKVVKDAITSGSEFETSLAKLGTIADTSSLSLDSMKGRIADMSSQMGISQSDLAEAAYSTISATGDTAHSLDLVEQAAKLATAGFTDTDSAISVLTTSLNAYGLQADQAQHISDSLITTQNLGVTTVADLASNMGRAIATASGYGVSLENLEAAYIGTTKSGISTAESTTYISGMLQELGKDGSTVSDIIKNQTGQSFGQLMASGSSLADVLKILMDSCGGDSEAFMNLWSSQEAGKGANAIVNQGLDTFNENLKTLQDQSGLTESAYGQMTDTFSWKMNDLKTRVQNLGISLFQDLYPVLSDVVDKAQEAIQNIDMDKLSSSVSKFIEGLVPFLSRLLDFMSGIISNLDIIIPVVSTLLGLGIGMKVAGLVSQIGGMLKGIESLSALTTFLQGPVGIVITLIAGAVAALIALYNENETFRNAVQAIWQGIQTVFETVWNAIGVVIQTIWTGIQTAWTTVLQPVFQAIGDFVQNILWPIIQVVFMAIGEVVQTVFELISGFWTNILQPVFQAIGDFLSGILGPVFSTIFDGIKTVVEGVFNAISGFWNTILQPVFSAIGDFISGTLGPIFSTVFDGIKNVVMTVFNAISGFWSGILQPVFSAIGNFLTGVLEAVFERVFNGIRNIVSTVFNAISGFWNNILHPVFEAIGNAAEALKNAVMTPLNAIKDTFENVFNGIRDFLSPIIDWLKGIFNFEWHLPSIKLPHFSVSGEFSLNPPSIPHFSVDWYKKAMDVPYMFKDATLFGAGEAGNEIMYGRDSLMRDIKEATADGSSKTVNQPVTINMTVYGAEGQDVAELAEEIEKRINQKISRQKAVFA